MEAKNLSICVPGGCPNKCPFCVAEQHENEYTTRYKKYPEEWLRRLNFASKHGVSSILLTGTGEPLSNLNFIGWFARENKKLNKPFDWIEIQTSGVGLLDPIEEQGCPDVLHYLKNVVRISTIALSVCDIFSSKNNASIMGIPEGKYYDLNELCIKIKDMGFNLRLSMNMTSVYNNVDPKNLFDMCKTLEVDQVTFRKMFSNGTGGKEDAWIKDHEYTGWEDINVYITDVGIPLHRLSFGPMKYSVNEIATVADSDCMSTTENETSIVRSMILRPDCKLYTHWGDRGSLIF